MQANKWVMLKIIFYVCFSVYSFYISFITMYLKEKVVATY